MQNGGLSGGLLRGLAGGHEPAGLLSAGKRGMQPEKLAKLTAENEEFL